MTREETLALIDGLIAADNLADGLRVSRRKVRADARYIGACIVIGKQVLLSPSDVAALLEYWRPAAKKASPPGGVPVKGTYEDILRLRKATRGGALERVRAKLTKGVANEPR